MAAPLVGVLPGCHHSSRSVPTKASWAIKKNCLVFAHLYCTHYSFFLLLLSTHTLTSCLYCTPSPPRPSLLSHASFYIQFLPCALQCKDRAVWLCPETEVLSSTEKLAFWFPTLPSLKKPPLEAPHHGGLWLSFSDSSTKQEQNTEDLGVCSS